MENAGSGTGQVRRVLSLLAGLAVSLLAGEARAQKCPNVLLVMQRSSSFALGLDGSKNPPSTWSVAVQNVSAALATFPSPRYGVSTYSAMGGGAACEADTRIEFLPAPGQATPISVALRQMIPSGGANLAGGLRKALTDGKLGDPQRGNVIILVTSGAGVCGVNELGDAVKQITDAAARNPPVRTVVVGIGSGSDPATLDRLAQAGGLARPGCGGLGRPCYYNGSDPKEVLAAFQAALPAGVPCGCDETCLTGGCNAGTLCTIANPGAAPACQPAPCDGVTCGAGQFCRAGTCQSLCPACGANQRCEGGRCVVDECVGKTCNANEVCVPGAGCVLDRCRESGVCCVNPATCDPVSGSCITDPCLLTRCPDGATCKGGWCAESAAPDMATSAPQDLATVGPGSPDLTTTPLPIPTSESGCSCRVSTEKGRGSSPWGTLLLAALCVAIVRRRAW